MLTAGSATPGMLRAHRSLSLLLFTRSLAFGAFTRSARWRLDSIEQTYAGAWCYRPGAISTARGDRCSDATLAALLKAHVNNINSSGLSIVYYDPADMSPLGGAGWTGWNDTTLPVGVCMSGEAPLGGAREAHYLTVCRLSNHDDDQDEPLTHGLECFVAAPQKFVGDGCYRPPASGPVLAEGPAALALAILGAIASVIAIWGAAWALGKYLRRRKARRAELADAADAVPLVGRAAVHDESAEPRSN